MGLILHTLRPERLKCACERDRFAAGYAERAGQPDMNYLERADLYAVYDDNRKMIAGYAVNSSPPLRYLDVLDRELADEVIARYGLAESQFCELTYLWIKRHSMSKSDRALLFSGAIWNAFASGKHYILGGSLARSIAANQMSVIRSPLYTGPARVHGKERQVWLYYVERYAALYHTASGIARGLVTGGIDLIKVRRPPPRTT